MAKTNLSTAVKRQIPEHIRKSYPLFVEFIQAYYDFLQQSNNHELETIHDVDTTLDEFLSKFKSEFAQNFPIHLVDNKPELIKRLREFYLSRGSEESFKFLFRVLFNKDATLFYPSEQILRVSDGRWQQDVSIFVIPDDANDNYTNHIGEIFYLVTTSGKVINTVCKNAIKYSEEITEIFIRREYIDEIDVGSKIYLEDGTHAGTVQLCPTKVKVYKGGKGFSVGSIFALKTQKGRGVIVKVTKVDSEGAIQALQIISFGLDYETKFYSYLSAKELYGWEYVHPLALGTGGSSTYEATLVDGGVGGEYTFNNATGEGVFNQIDWMEDPLNPGEGLVIVEVIRANVTIHPTFALSGATGTAGVDTVTVQGLQTGDQIIIYGVTSLGTAPGDADPAYNEGTGGFIDYGWGSYQTYMYYDANIPVGDVSFASDRYFADAAYVGDVIQQFFNDGSKSVLDEDLAIIEVEVGAVARYPGYYIKNNGFISDDMFIHDGEYYQAFSYVIRVEEELRRYADIIKALVHPAGMKIFSEYNIYNELVLQPNTGFKQILNLLLPLFDETPSNVYIDDRGYGYDSYDITVIGGVTTVVPSGGANKVYAPQFKSSQHLIKTKVDQTSANTTSIKKNVFKNYDDPVPLLEEQSKHVQKPLDSTVDQLSQIDSKAFDKLAAAVVSQIEFVAKDTEKGFAHDVNSPNSQHSNHLQKPENSDLLAPLSDHNKEFFASKASTTTAAFTSIINDFDQALSTTTNIPTAEISTKLYEKALITSTNVPTAEIDNKIIQLSAQSAIANIVTEINYAMSIAKASTASTSSDLLGHDIASVVESTQAISDLYSFLLSLNALADDVAVAETSFLITQLRELASTLLAPLSDFGYNITKNVNNNQVIEETIINKLMEKGTINSDVSLSDAGNILDNPYAASYFSQDYTPATVF